jgi:hypothetical protein
MSPLPPFAGEGQGGGAPSTGVCGGPHPGPPPQRREREKKGPGAPGFPRLTH